jgi:hypothetical protein
MSDTSKSLRRLKELSLLAIALIFFQASSMAGTGTHGATKDTIVVNKLLVSKKYKIKLYPNLDGEVVFFTASGEAGKVYQLYVFDFDGNLIKQTQIRNRETTLLTDFSKGSYTFDVFSDDERIENGTMTVR